MTINYVVSGPHCLCRVLGIIGQNLSVSKSNRSHVCDISKLPVQDDPKLWMIMVTVPKPNRVVGGSILGYETVSLLDGKLAR